MTQELYDLSKKVVDTLRAGSMTITTAESCTGGYIASTLTNVEHSSQALKYGWVVYSAESKENLLGVPEGIIAHYGVVSAPVAVALSSQALKRANAYIGVGVTGNIGNTTNDDKSFKNDVFIGVAYRHCGTLKTKVYYYKPEAGGEETGPNSHRVLAKEGVTRAALMHVLHLLVEGEVG